MKPILLALFLSGCALTSKATPVDFRYFSPEAMNAHPAKREAGPALRLGRITSSATLRTRIVHRDSEWELGTYETLRWTDNPEVYVRHALSRALFDETPLTPAVGGSAPAVDVEVSAFEEVRRGRARAGRVQLRWVLHDDRSTLGSGVITSEKDAAGDDIEHVVAAIASAMNDASGRVASAVAKEMKP
jgi:uncharacterized lipoprotein YmbA